MERDSPSPHFTSGRETATFLATSGILHQAWEEIRSVSASTVDTFLVNEYEGVVYVTFPSFYVEDFTDTDGTYAGGSIPNERTVFSACLKMERFLNQKEEQAIIIVGHSVGGAVATLATLWFLENRARRRISPFCITFGSPLVISAELGELIGREDWSENFCHVVSEYDIVPRMLLAPFVSITDPLDTIVPHWGRIMGIDCAVGSELSIQEASRTLLRNVLQCTSTIEKNYPAFRNPYRPFGTYMFCSTHGAVCIENSEAVLKMLHFTMQSKEGMSFDQIAGACISEHTKYGHMLDNITENLHKATETANIVSDSSFEMGIALELEAMGVGAQNVYALLALREAGYLKRKQDINIEKLYYHLKIHHGIMAQIEWYKRVCKENGPGYYDAYKQRNESKDFHVHRITQQLDSFWDEIVEMGVKRFLPDGFLFQNKLINAGTAYRRLVEPLDIADHYHSHMNNESYLSNQVRPTRHIVLEKWMKEKEGTLSSGGRTKFASLTQDSCFWAHLEEACKALKNLPQEQEQVLKERLEKFEDYAWNMINDRSISADVFCEQSSFMMWWQQYSSRLQLQSSEWKSTSLLFIFMENERWKFEI